MEVYGLTFTPEPNSKCYHPLINCIILFLAFNYKGCINLKCSDPDIHILYFKHICNFHFKLDIKESDEDFINNAVLQAEQDVRKGMSLI